MIDLNWRLRCLMMIRDSRTNPFIRRHILMFQGYFITLIGAGECFAQPKPANDNG